MIKKAISSETLHFPLGPIAKSWPISVEPLTATIHYYPLCVLVEAS